VEHPATDMPCGRLAGRGLEVRRVPVTRTGLPRLDEAVAVIDDDAALVTILHAQNEIGTVQPMARLAAAVRRREVAIHLDAARSLGKIPLDVRAIGADAMSIAGHKLYAPKGIGAPYLRRGCERPSPLAGAGQERGRRPGTTNVPGIVGLGCACEIAARRLAADAERIAALREAIRTKQGWFPRSASNRASARCSR
jgi:cysteine desulfurase